MAFWKVSALLVLCAGLAATITAPAPAPSIVRKECLLVEDKLNPGESQCARHFNFSFNGMFPNSRDLSMPQAVSEFSAFLPLLELNNYCSHVLHSFLCYHYFPPCAPESHPAYLPCREVCEVAWKECLDLTYQMYSIPPPEHLNCTNFPSKYTSNYTVCPDSGTHCLPVVTGMRSLMTYRGALQAFT